jgi:DNA polymerase III epsilon subunit-like protein
MILLSFDLETTGLDVEKDQVIELGAILYSTAQKKCLDSLGMLVKTDISITSRITEITNIHPAAVERFGYDSEIAFEALGEMLCNADALIGYNSKRFDSRILDNWAKRFGLTLPGPPKQCHIDLYCDLPWQIPVGKLGHVAADLNLESVSSFGIS